MVGRFGFKAALSEGGSLVGWVWYSALRAMYAAMTPSISSSYSLRKRSLVTGGSVTGTFRSCKEEASSCL